MSVWTTAGVQQESCSNTVAVSDTVTWNEVIFSTPIVLTEGTWALVYNLTGSLATYYYDETGTGNKYDSGACPTFPTTDSTRKATCTVADYDAH